MALTKVSRGLLSTSIVDNGNATAITIDSSENVGIGTSSPTAYTNFTTLAVGDSAQGGVLELQYAGVQAARIVAQAANTLTIATNNTERMRISSAGHTTFGTTDLTPADNSINGTSILSDGRINHNAQSQPAAVIGRTGTDGAIIDLRKSGSTVGSIGTVSDRLFIGNEDTFLTFQGAADRIYPATSSGGVRDAAIDLGYSGGRFKDLYLAGKVSASLGLFNSLGSDSGSQQAFWAAAGGATYQAGYEIHWNTGGNNSRTTKMVLDSFGNLLVGETSSNPYGGLTTAHVFTGASSTGGAAPFGIYNSTGTANVPVLNLLSRDASTDTTSRFLQFYANVTSSTNTSMGGIVGNGASNVQFASISDVREKENITTISGSLSKITSLNPVEFDWIASGEHCKAGFVAQEVEEVFPEFVVENMASEGQEERKGLTGGMTGGIVAHLVKAIQEQQAIIELQAAAITDLTTRLTALENT